MNNIPYIYREFDKIDDRFIATNHFFISLSKNEFVTLNKSVFQKIIPHSENLYVHIYNNQNSYINLILISNISFSLNDNNINKANIIKKYIDYDTDIDDNLLEDLYYNETFAKKINMQVPINSINNTNIKKNYLFKINIIEVNQSFYQENNIFI